MVPLDDDTVALIDRIVEYRSPGRPLRHPKSGRLVEFLLTHHGRRISAGALRFELQRAAEDAGIGAVVPHQLRHTFATALVNAGCSLQSLMAMLGHVSAEMSLRYGRLFDATVRADYEKALTLAKGRLGPVLPERTPVALNTDWQSAPLIKARLGGGYCVRTLAQGTCAYTNICEHCPNFRSDATFLPTLLTQRVDTEALWPTLRPGAGARKRPGTGVSSNASTGSFRMLSPHEHGLGHTCGVGLHRVDRRRQVGHVHIGRHARGSRQVHSLPASRTAGHR